MSTFYNIAADCLDEKNVSPAFRHKICLKIAAESKTTSFSFAQIYELCSQAAHFIESEKIQPKDRVVLKLKNPLTFLILFLGCIKRGAIPIPVSSALTDEETNFIVSDSGAVRLFESFDDAILKNFPTHYQTQKTLENDPAFWLYTSGTTGIPKGVIHAHRSIPAHDGRVYFWQDFKEDDVVFNTSSLNWSYALTASTLDWWRHGGTTVLSDGVLSPLNILKVIDENKVTTFMSVPGIYRRLVAHLERRPSKVFESVRVCLSAGEKLHAIIRQQFEEVTSKTIYEGLGMTEHSVYLVQPFGEKPVEGSCGRAVQGATATILKEDLSGEADIEETGILASHKSCPGLMLGYHDREDETKTCFFGDWFLSGDLAKRDKDGNFYYLGRRDDVMTSGGYRISPLEVEAVLNHCENVSESLVAGLEVAPGKTLVVAFIVTKEGINKDALKAEAQKHLAAYKIPREFYFVDGFPKTSNGKLKRKEYVSWWITNN